MANSSVWGDTALVSHSWSAPLTGERKVDAGQQLENVCAKFLEGLPLVLPTGSKTMASTVFGLRVRYDEKSVAVDLTVSQGAWRRAIGPDRSWAQRRVFGMLARNALRQPRAFLNLILVKALPILPPEKREAMQDHLFSLQLDLAMLQAKQQVVEQWQFRQQLATAAALAFTAQQKSQAMRP